MSQVWALIPLKVLWHLVSHKTQNAAFKWKNLTSTFPLPVLPYCRFTSSNADVGGFTSHSQTISRFLAHSKTFFVLLPAVQGAVWHNSICNELDVKGQHESVGWQTIGQRRPQGITVNTWNCLMSVKQWRCSICEKTFHMYIYKYLYAVPLWRKHSEAHSRCQSLLMFICCERKKKSSQTCTSLPRQLHPGGRGNYRKDNAWPRAANIDLLLKGGQLKGQGHQMDRRQTGSKCLGIDGKCWRKSKRKEDSEMSLLNEEMN